MNFATELRLAYTNAVREVLVDSSIIDPKKYGKQGMQAVKELVKHKLQVCGSIGKA